MLGPLLLFTGVFFFNFLSRTIVGPLLPVMEAEFGIGHATAGGLILWLSGGYFMGLLFSSALSHRLGHHGTVVLSALGVSFSLGLLSLAPSVGLLQASFALLGLLAGLYLPSGIAAITTLVSQQHWGKALAVHELAPNLSFGLAPLMAEALLGWKSWRGVMLAVGIASGAMGLAFAGFLGVRGAKGRGFDPKTISTLLKDPVLWATAGLISLGVGAGLGIYTMLPLRLIEEGMARQDANTMLGLSRLSAIGAAFLAGWVTDRMGARRALELFLPAIGMATLALGVLTGLPLKLVVFLQPALSACFFPAFFSILSEAFSQEVRNVAVSLSNPVGILVGAGVIPAAIGALGQKWNLAVGMGATGALLLVAPVFLLRFFKQRAKG